MKINELLDSRQIPYQFLRHPTAYTANRMAQALHVPGREVAKSVLLRTDEGKYLLAVVPANCRLDLEQLQEDLGQRYLDLASEAEIEQVFPDCETGAVPPFGSLYHVPTIVDEHLAEDEEIVFAAQNHQAAIRMAYQDFEGLEHPRHGHFVQPA